MFQKLPFHNVQFGFQFFSTSCIPLFLVGTAAIELNDDKTMFSSNLPKVFLDFFNQRNPLGNIY